MTKFQPSVGLREHMLTGNPVSLIEAMVLFGVQAPNAEFNRMKKDGFIIKNRRVSMVKVLDRMNKMCVCIPPENLPVREIFLTEYWVSI